jgi:hypothetical protein
MYKDLNQAEDTVLTQITVTNGFFDGGVGTLAGSNFTTASLSTTQKSYYYNVQYNSKDHFGVTYGHIGGSGSAEQSTTVEGTTQAIYKEFFNVLEPDSVKLRDETGFLIVDGTNGANAVSQSDCYFISAERLQMKDRLNPGTWTITLSGSTTAGTVGTSLSLTDNSKTTSPSAAPFGQRYDIISGSAGSAIGSNKYGFFYPDAGVFVLSVSAVSASLPGDAEFKTSGSSHTGGGTGLAPDTRVNTAADNAWKLTRALELGTVTLRSEEKQYIYDYFCRAKTTEFNLSNNATFWSGSNWQIRHSDMVTNPQTYITEVGLYDNSNTLVAVGKLSSALNKNFSSEAIIKVRLTY